MAKPPKRIAKRSVFSEYRKLPRVGQAFEEKDDWPVPEPLDSPGLTKCLPEGNRLRRYFGLGQNDASVIHGWYRGCEVGLILNHYDIERLAGFAGLIRWSDRMPSLPVTLTFKGVTEFYAVRTVENGGTQLVQRSRRNLFRNLFDVAFFDVKLFEPNRVVVELHLNGRRPFKRQAKRRGGWWVNDYIICISAERIELEEGYREGWIRHFGAEALPLLDAFENVWPVPRWAQPDFESWLDENHGSIDISVG